MAVYLVSLYLEYNHSIIIHRHRPLDYKLFNIYESEVVERMQSFSNPWRYPFCDLFVYKYNESADRFIFKQEKERLWWPNNF